MGTVKKHEGLIVIVILGVVAYMMLPEIVAWATQAVNQVSAAITAIGLKAAIAGGLIGSLVLVSPWHRKHGAKFITGSAFAAAAAGIIPSALTWVNGNAPGVVLGGLTGTGHILNALFGGL